MSEQGKSSRKSSKPGQEFSGVEVCFFRYIAMLNVPEEWRKALLHFGHALFGLTLDVYGVAPEEDASLPTTVKRVNAIANDLRVSSGLLEELGLEPGASEMSEAEARLCRIAGKLAVSVREVSEDLAVAVLASREEE